MARLPLFGDAAARTPPFCWRVLTPLLAAALTQLGLGVNAAFWLLTNLFLVGFLWCLYVLLVGRGVVARLATLGLVRAGRVPAAVRWYEYQYWMTDPLGLLLVTAALVLIDRGRDRDLLLLSLLGVAARESYVLVFGCLLLSRVRRDGLVAALGSTARVALPALGLLVAIRLWVPASPAPALASVVLDALDFRSRHLLDNQLYLATIGSFGVFVPLVLLCPGSAVTALRQRPGDLALVAGAYASLLLGTNTDRLLAYALPAVVAALLPCVARLAEARSLALVGGGLVLAQGLFYALTPFHGSVGLSLYQPTSGPILAVMGAVWLGGRLLLRRPPGG
jgi:hypothetical protein